MIVALQLLLVFFCAWQVQAASKGYKLIGQGICVDKEGDFHDLVKTSCAKTTNRSEPFDCNGSVADFCEAACDEMDSFHSLSNHGFILSEDDYRGVCFCLYEDHALTGRTMKEGSYFLNQSEGTGPVDSIQDNQGFHCYAKKGDPEGSGAFGDPHIRTWTGESYDFHGVCDLVLMRNTDYDNGVAMDIHIRSKRIRLWSFVSSAAIRIGKDVFEVIGGKGENQFWINGVKNQATTEEIDRDVHLGLTLSGFPILFRFTNNMNRKFIIDLGNEEKIVIKTWNAFVSVSIQHATFDHFGNSVGLMGSFIGGAKLARDNKKIIGDENAFGQEWQVLATEGKIFHNDEGPQYPKKCEIPSSSEMRRRLGDNTVTIEDAKKSCAGVEKEDMDPCVFDVMATNNIGTAGVY